MINFKIKKLEYPWKKYTFKKNNKIIIFYFSGWVPTNEFDRFVTIINSGKSDIKNEIIAWLKSQCGHFGIILKTDDCLYLATDKIASFNLFYSNFKRFCIEISSYSSEWINKDLDKDIDKYSSTLYQHSGYTIGNKTMRNSVKKVLPGELCIIKKTKNEPLFSQYRYFIFYPNFKNKKNTKFLEKNLGKVIDYSISRLIDQANGRTIVLSLSAGLDSRLILTKLLEFNYNNIYCFSYGTKNNFEAKEAEALAKRLNVQWTFIHDENVNIKRDSFYNGNLGKYFLKYSGLHTTAAMTEILYLQKLLKCKPELKNAVFTNGQSGDFITGGHLPNEKIKTLDQFLTLFSQKHFSLINNNYFSRKTLRKFYECWFETSYLKNKLDDFYSLWQLMEWQERQAFYVAHQVKAYDFLGLEWSMPLWNGKIMKFYENVPLRLQINQKLYIQFLKNWNYKGVFDPLRVNPVAWSNFNFLIIITGKLIHVVFGRNYKESFYKILDYYSTNNYQYNYFSFKKYIKNFKNIRNAVTLFTQQNYSNLKKHSSKLPNSIL